MSYFFTVVYSFCTVYNFLQLFTVCVCSCSSDLHSVVTDVFTVFYIVFAFWFYTCIRDPDPEVPGMCLTYTGLNVFLRVVFAVPSVCSATNPGPGPAS